MVESPDRLVSVRRVADNSGLIPVYIPSDIWPSCMYVLVLSQPVILALIATRIVAIHGLTGHPRHSWTHSSGFSWLDNFSRELPDTCVLTYGYNGAPEATASALLWDLIDMRTKRDVCSRLNFD